MTVRSSHCAPKRWQSISRTIRRDKEEEDMKNAVIYARYSCEKQNEQSIEGQLRVCNEFAERNGYFIVHHYIDRAVSGKNDHRNEFQKMLKDSANHAFDYVIVYS